MATTMRALKVQAPGQIKVIPDTKLPELRPGYVLVKVSCVGLNPADWKKAEWEILATPGTTIGCDHSGTVEKIGPEVRRTDLKVGDRVAGLTHGGNKVQPEDGCFAEYAVVKEHLLIKLPDHVSDEAAASFGVAFVTTSLSIYHNMGLPWPNSPTTEKLPILIYGGATGTALYTIQFAKMSGLQVITTCSPRNFDLVKSLGADAAFDYSDPECGKKINDYTKDSLRYALDCIGTDNSPQICAAAISSSGGKYASLVPVDPYPRPELDNTMTWGYTTFGEEHVMLGRTFPAVPEVVETARKFFELAEQILRENKIKPQVTVREGNLEGISEGFDLMRQGKVRATKLVYCVKQT